MKIHIQLRMFGNLILLISLDVVPLKEVICVEVNLFANEFSDELEEAVNGLDFGEVV